MFFVLFFLFLDDLKFDASDAKNGVQGRMCLKASKNEKSPDRKLKIGQTIISLIV